MMKKVLFMAAVVAVLFYVVSCGKGAEVTNDVCTNKPVATDSTALLNFASANNITATKDASGMYYQVVSTGSGVNSPNANSFVRVFYKGSLLNGTTFDSTATGDTAKFYLYQLIPAWQIGVPKIKAGGRIKMLVPSALAYGCKGARNQNGVVVIPENAPIYFDVTLIDFQ